MILSLETATRQTCSVALHDCKNGRLLSIRNGYQIDNHLVALSNFIDDLFSSNNFHYTDIKAIAVSAGPGSYTGLRIGVSMAKSFCYALSVPLIPVNTLYSMARLRMTAMSFPDSNTLICPMLDARRDEVYTAVYNLAGVEIIPPHAYILQPESFSSLLEKQPVIFVGDGAKKARTILGNHAHATFEESLSPQAELMGFIAFEYYQKGAFSDIAYFEPYYLKDFIGKKSV